ncbi:hypothetical protein JX266_012234 [Neoarthrinium moseri]|nr:hypothetical protein JX266_012234 [Neoarthrinium moseri]
MAPAASTHLASWSTKPSTQNFIAGVGVAFSAGVFTSLNLLGAGGANLEQSHVIQTANAILSSVWFFSACFGGTYLRFLGPGLTMGLGISTFAIYVGSLWYYGITGQKAFTLIAGAVIGLGAGAVFITSGYISVAYSRNHNRGKFVAIQQTLQATGTIICSIVPVIINKDNSIRATTPAAIYITYIVIVLASALLAFITLRRAHQVHGMGLDSTSETNKGVWTALKGNIRVFKETKLLLLLPAFFSAGSFLIYLGSVNVFNNTLRARSLLSFVALVVQIPFGHLLHLILDNYTQHQRLLIGLIPSLGSPWSFFVMNWTASVLWQYLVPWYIGSLSLTSDRLSHYIGVQRGFLAAGEAICFGIDAAGLNYLAFAGVIFAFYAIRVAILAFFAIFYIQDDDDLPKGRTFSHETKDEGPSSQQNVTNLTGFGQQSTQVAQQSLGMINNT